LDTRTKILSWNEFARTQPPVVVAAYLDPLTVEHAELLEELAVEYGPLAVALCTPGDPLLPPEARAPLAAALACVQAVSIADGDLSMLPPATKVIDLRDEDLERRKALIEHVHSRHGR
jgi:hypothetical protein